MQANKHQQSAFLYKPQINKGQQECFFVRRKSTASRRQSLVVALTVVALTIVALTVVALTVVALTVVALTVVALTVVALTVVALTVVALTVVALTVVALSVVALTVVALTVVALTVVAVLCPRTQSNSTKDKARQKEMGCWKLLKTCFSLKQWQEVLLIGVSYATLTLSGSMPSTHIANISTIIMMALTVKVR